MTAVLFDDVVTTSPARSLTGAAGVEAARRGHATPIGGGDPMVDAAARLLSIPLRQMYAVLWRVGLIEVRA